MSGLTIASALRALKNNRQTPDNISPSIELNESRLGQKWIHVFLDNATYHHAILVREWLKQSGRRIRLHFTPSYCPHLAPIERCWGLMHEHVTHNQSYETLAQFRLAIMTFLRRTIPKKWDRFRDRITDNFRVISPNDFRVVA